MSSNTNNNKISRANITTRRTSKYPTSYMSHRETPKLRPLALPESLNEYFAEIAPDLGNVFYFMRKFIAEDETIARLLKAYEDLPTFRKRDPRKIDLDAICELEGIDKTAVRERVLIAAQRYWGSKFAIDLTMQGKRVMDEMIAVALDSSHPDSQRCKEIILQYTGVMSVPKSAQINLVKVDQSTTTNNELNITNNSNNQSVNELNKIEMMIKGDQERRMLTEGQQEYKIDLSEIEKDSEDAVLVGVGESDYVDSDDDEDDDDELEDELEDEELEDNKLKEEEEEGD